MKNKGRKIKSSKLSLAECNSDKHYMLLSFIQEYQKAVSYCVDYLWNNKISFKTKSGMKVLDVQHDLLDCPMFLSTKNISFQTPCSARALKCAATQALGIVFAHITKRKRLLYVLEQFKSQGKRTRAISKKLLKAKLIKPDLSHVFPELNSICCNYQDAKDISYFDGVITLSSIGKKFGKIILPIKHTRHSRKLEEKGNLLKSFQVEKDTIALRYEITKVPSKTSGKIVGADTGMKTCISLSDKQTTPQDVHGHTIDTICKKISHKVKGLKAFHKALAHRDNFIGWSVKQLNLSDVKQINLERISNFRKGKNVGKYLNYFGEMLIQEKLMNYAEDSGVQVNLQSSAFRSQRCSSCGYVSSKNRKGKLFSCKHCHFQTDADYNASCNHEQSLPSAAFLLRLEDRPREFIWKADGFFDLSGQEITVPGKKKK
jgi:transposase